MNAQAQLADLPLRPATFAGSEVAGLPGCVERYFRSVLPEGQALGSRVRIVQRGEMLLDPKRGTWRPFDAVETFAVRPPEFVWDARVRLRLGLSIHVVDSFRDGRGSMQATILGAVPVLSAQGTPEISAGALHRYLAEAPLLPSALLPRNGVRWSPLDDTSARASLSVGQTAVSLDFRFGDDGLVQSVFTSGRLREVHGRYIPTPWRGRWSGYERALGILVPRRGEVEWLLHRGPELYWRGEMLSFADALAPEGSFGSVAT
jgi:hypothetical protein